MTEHRRVSYTDICYAYLSALTGLETSRRLAKDAYVATVLELHTPMLITLRAASCSLEAKACPSSRQEKRRQLAA